eukprot:Unigene5358_Nuclearia_a/m.16429 Unigene5358_Nuclearia_a/g.16429  ORF Unigene5358_Nuclearia_a/g.16429 Unigene5358_Nuclearia_a/m.16429 type:complete len:268 (-) Unigene5358_Nuclearia_a:101-904(-)
MTTTKRTATISVAGARAVQALIARRPGWIQRLFVAERMRHDPAAVAAAAHMTQHGRMFRFVRDAELARVAQTPHHGGIVATIEQPEPRAPSPEDLRVWERTGAPVLVLDRIQDAFNLGSIMRTAAWFSVANVVLAQGPGGVARATSEAWRISQGAAAYIDLFLLDDLPTMLQRVANSHAVVGSALSRRARPLSQYHHEAGTARPRPIVLVLGNESEGISAAVEDACTHLVRIDSPAPGGPPLQSMNVTAAGAILMWHLFAHPQQTSI